MKKREGASDLPPIDWSRFEGLDTPNYTQTPDAIFDWVMAYLTGAELKVLLYIVRRTFGFKKAEDAISIDQLCNGIVTREGRRLDLGTGLKRPTVLEAVRTLREKKLILTRQQTDIDIGSRPTMYALNLKQEQLFRTITENLPVVLSGTPPGMPEHTPGSTTTYPGVYHGKPPGMPRQQRGVGQGIPQGYVQPYPQQTVIQQTEQQETEQQQTVALDEVTLLLLDQLIDRLLRDQRMTAVKAAAELGIDGENPIVNIARQAARLMDEGVEPRVARELALNDPVRVADWLDHPEWWEKAQNPAGLLVKRLRQDGPGTPARLNQRYRRA